MAAEYNKGINNLKVIFTANAFNNMNSNLNNNLAGNLNDKFNIFINNPIINLFSFKLLNLSLIII